MFVGRKQEINKLRELVEGQRPRIGVIYGRRRIGKSELIRESLRGRQAYFFEGLENQSKANQLTNFAFQFRQQFQASESEAKTKNWREAFAQLNPILEKNPGTVVFDEFQWMANYRSQIVSDLKMIWDQYWSRIPGVNLILCGSIASFMTSRVIKSNALYGRTEVIIHLTEFKLSESRALLNAKSEEEVLDAHMVVGGVPLYLNLLATKSSVQLGVNELAFTKDGYLVEEFDRIFTSHFGGNRDFQAIIEVLAKHPYGLLRTELAKLAKVDSGGGFSRNLYDLESAGFIRAISPIKNPSSKRLVRYILSDAYVRFYFEFILPNLAKIKRQNQQHLFSSITQSGKYQNWKGRSFEYVCMEHAPRVAFILGFSGIEYTFGPHFKSADAKGEGVQIDLLFKRADKVITLCECKYRQRSIGMDIIDSVEEKVERLQQDFPRYTIQRVLLYHGNISPDLEKSGYFYAMIHSGQLFDN